jgi:hypothetical protein
MALAAGAAVGAPCRGGDGATDARRASPGPPPLLALAKPQGVGNCVGGYDLLNACRLGRADVRTPAVGMTFSRDGSLLVVATQVRLRVPSDLGHVLWS